jgi:hypothetical protein
MDEQMRNQQRYSYRISPHFQESNQGSSNRKRRKIQTPRGITILYIVTPPPPQDGQTRVSLAAGASGSGDFSFAVAVAT